MSKTRHISARMSQRGIRQRMIDITMKFGIKKKDQIILNKKGLRALHGELLKTMKVVQDLIKKGGLVVVESDDKLITTYRLDSYKH